MMLCLKEKFEKNKFWLIFSLTSTYLWGLAAHAYFLFDNSVSHDSLKEFHATIYGNVFKVELGRFLAPLYRAIFRGDATMSWLIGILGLFWLGLAVFFVVRIFCVESKLLAFLVAGVMSTNITVSALISTYVHDFDCYMFSLLCAAMAVYLWKKNPSGWIPGTVLIAAAMGIYQGFLFTAVTLAMMVCIFALLDGDSFQTVLIRGTKAIAMCLLGGLLYFIGLKAALRFSHISLLTGTGNSLGNIRELTPKAIWDLSAGAYKYWFQNIWYTHSAYSGRLVKRITMILAGMTVVSLAWGLAKKRVHIWGMLLCLILILLLPYGMNLIYILAGGFIHEVMTYSNCFSYLVILLLTNWLAKDWNYRYFQNQFASKVGSFIHILCMVLVFILLYGNVQFANGMHLKKDIEYDAYLSLMTRIVSQMESESDYVPGETSVFFAGLPEDLNDQIPGFEKHSLAIGTWFTDVLVDYEQQRFQAYFDYVLCAPIKLLEDFRWNAMLTNPAVLDMPNYPAQGCIKMMDDVLVVKLGDIPEY